MNRRFPGAWDEVQDLYKQRKEEARQAEIKAKQMAKLKAEQEKEFWDHVLHWILEGLKLILVIGGAILMFYLIWINRCTSGTC